MKKYIKIIITMVVLCFLLSGCNEREAQRVSYNVSKQADNFNVVRRLTVINTRSDKCILQMVGKMSIEDQKDGIAVLVEVDRDKSLYQKLRKPLLRTAFRRRLSLPVQNGSCQPPSPRFDALKEQCKQAFKAHADQDHAQRPGQHFRRF